jgi:hypothetical protein
VSAYASGKKNTLQIPMAEEMSTAAGTLRQNRKEKMALYSQSLWITAYEYHSNVILSKAIFLTPVFSFSRSYLRVE